MDVHELYLYTNLFSSGTAIARNFNYGTGAIQKYFTLFDKIYRPPSSSITNCHTLLTTHTKYVTGHNTPDSMHFTDFFALDRLCQFAMLAIESRGESHYFSNSLGYTHWNQSDRPTTLLPCSIILCCLNSVHSVLQAI